MREPSWDAVDFPVGPHESLPPIVLRPAVSSAARLNASCASLWIAPVTLRALTAAPVTPLVGTNNTANQHCAVGFEPLPRDLKTRLSASSRQNVAGPGRAKATSGTSGPPRWTTSEPPSSGDPDLRTGNDASPPRLRPQLRRAIILSDLEEMRQRPLLVQPPQPGLEVDPFQRLRIT